MSESRFSFASLKRDSGRFAEWFDIRSDAVPTPLLVGLTMTLLLLVLWASLARMDRIVRGEGRVVPTESTQVLQNLDGGIVSEILISEGQTVRKGQVLMRLHSTDASAALNQTEVKGLALKARIARLQAEAAGAGAIALPPGLTAATPEMAAELSAFRARRATLAQAEATQRAAFEQKKDEIAEAEQKLRNYQVEHDTAVRQKDVMANLRAQRAASQLELLDAQAKEQRLQSLIQETEALIPGLKAAAQEAQSRVAQVEAQFRSEAQTELAAVQLDLSRSEDDAKGQADRLSRTQVVSPADGVVNHVFVKTIGGVTRPGEPLIEITPMNGDLIVEGRIKPGERGELMPGLRTSIKISAYDYAGVGALPGELIDISADTLPDERGERYYRVRAKVDKAEFLRTGRSIYPGMTASLDIVVGKRPIMAYFLSPVLRFATTAFHEAR